MTQIMCEREDCAFNMNQSCCADKIDIIETRLFTDKWSVCASYKKKYSSPKKEEQ